MYVSVAHWGLLPGSKYLGAVLVMNFLPIIHFFVWRRRLDLLIAKNVFLFHA